MIRSAWGPAAMRSDTAMVTRPPMATMPAEGRDGDRSRGPAGRRWEGRLATAAPQGLACLMMATATSLSEASSCTRRQAASASKTFR